MTDCEYYNMGFDTMHVSADARNTREADAQWLLQSCNSHEQRNKGPSLSNEAEEGQRLSPCLPFLPVTYLAWYVSSRRRNESWVRSLVRVRLSLGCGTFNVLCAPAFASQA